MVSWFGGRLVSIGVCERKIHSRLYARNMCMVLGFCL